MAIPRLSKEDLELRLDGAAGDVPVILDVRLKYPFEHSTMTLPGAIRLAPDGVPAALTSGSLPRDRDIVLYDSDPGEIVSERVAVQLLGAGHRVFVLQGGIAEWAAAKLPTDSKAAPQPASPVGAQKG